MTNTNTTTISEAELLHHRDVAIGQMRFTREYLLGLLEGVSAEQWHVIPPGATTHIAWQVGHLAVAQYGLMLFRQRGRAEGDIELMPGWLRKNFGKGTQPSPDPSINPSREELLTILDRIHQRSLTDAASYSALSLAEPAEMPYAVFPMKVGALLFAPIHESIHIGQIGVLRRMLGLSPVR
jgi:DinB superfamily